MTFNQLLDRYNTLLARWFDAPRGSATREILDAQLVLVHAYAMRVRA
jgi:hypothetical protein